MTDKYILVKTATGDRRVECVTDTFEQTERDALFYASSQIFEVSKVELNKGELQVQLQVQKAPPVKAPSLAKTRARRKIRRNGG